MQSIEKVIKNTNEQNQNKIDWTKKWSTKYEILKTYQKEINIEKYKKQIRKLLNELKEEYKYDELEAMLILKDILYHEYKDKNN